MRSLQNVRMDKTYLKNGDCVRLRQHIQSPTMLIVRKEVSLFKDNPTLKGFRCRWFTDSGLLQEAVFDARDLELVNE